MRTQTWLAPVAALLFLSACNAPGGSSPSSQTATGSESTAPSTAPSTSSSTSTSTSASEPAAPSPSAGRVFHTDALVYNGSGVSASDATNTAAILKSNGWSYQLVDSPTINAMTQAQLEDFGVIIFPGGLANTEDSGLTAATHANLKAAVEAGVGYVGFCAGAFEAGDYGSWGLGLAPDAFDYYVAESQGITEEVVTESFADGSSHDLVWYGGPQLGSWGDVVAKYSDGTSALAESYLGKGLVVLSGTHPEAPPSWKTSSMPQWDVNAAYAVAMSMFTAAKTGNLLPHY